MKIEVPKYRIAEFCRRNHIRRMTLFGSVLRDDFARASDVDVLVEFEPGTRIGCRRRAAARRSSCTSTTGGSCTNNDRPLDNVLLITPNEGLSEQHMTEMAASDIPRRRFDLNESGLMMTGRTRCGSSRSPSWWRRSAAAARACRWRRSRATT